MRNKPTINYHPYGGYYDDRVDEDEMPTRAAEFNRHNADRPRTKVQRTLKRHWERDK